jgi:hypothetical protein
VIPAPLQAASLMLWKGRFSGSGVAVGGTVGSGVPDGLGVGLDTVGTPITTVGVGDGVTVGSEGVGLGSGVAVSVGAVFSTWIPRTKYSS